MKERNITNNYLWLLGVVPRTLTLLEQFRLAQHNRFGKSSESQPAQLDLFNEVEEEVVTDSADDEQTIS